MSDSGYMRKQAKCVYLACEESVADDLSRTLLAGANAVDRLAELEQGVEALADELTSLDSGVEGMRATRDAEIGDQLYALLNENKTNV